MENSINIWFLLIAFIVFIVVVALINKRILGEFKIKYKELERQGKLRYSELANLLPQLVVEIDKEGRFTFINNAGLSFIGYSKFDLEKELNIFDIIHPDDKEHFNEDFLYLLEGGINKGQEYRIITRQKKVYFVVLFLQRMSAVIENREGLRGFIIDISDRKTLERKVLSTVLDTEDKERRRFSEDLHDGLGPLLSTIKLYVNQMKSSKVSLKESVEMFNYANELLDEAISTTRNIANNILPGSILDNGLIAAVRTFIHHIEQAGGNIQISFNTNVNQRFCDSVEINFYRIITELVNNTLKHANANQLEINIILDDDFLTLNYSDNGVGFIIDEVKGGLGHGNIANRAQSLNAEYSYISQPNKGMSYELKIKREIVRNKRS